MPVARAIKHFYTVLSTKQRPSVVNTAGTLHYLTFLKYSWSHLSIPKMNGLSRIITLLYYIPSHLSTSNSSGGTHRLIMSSSI